jgi:thymidine kinase
MGIKSDLKHLFPILRYTSLLNPIETQSKKHTTPMAKLYFYYSAMNAGKTTLLLQAAYNYEERGIDTLLLTPRINTRDKTHDTIGTITSRIGLTARAQTFDPTTDFLTIMETALHGNPNIGCILIDEAQFLTQSQVMALAQITDLHHIPVLTYGLRTDFQAKPFEGSLYLLALADHLIELKTICHCGRKATMNMRITPEGQKITQGDQILIGGNDQYVPTCRKHFFEGRSK